MPKLPTTSTSSDQKPYPASSPRKKPSVKQDPDSTSSGPPASPSKGSIKKWSKEDKIEILLKVVAASNPNWEEIAKDFGKTKNQVHDQWRQHILPTLKTEGRVSRTE